MERTRIALPGLLARRLAVGTIAVASALALAGCAAGNTATSRKDYAPGDGLIGTSGPVRALNVLVVGSEGSTDGVIVMTLSNRGPGKEQLRGIQASSGTVELNGPTTIPDGGALRFSNDTPTTAVLRGMDVKPGAAIELTLDFDQADPIRLRTVVMPADGDYTGITPSASPTPTPTETPTATETPSPSP